MNTQEFKKFPIAATVLSIVAILLSVIAITSSLMEDTYLFAGTVVLGLLLLVASVLFIAGLTTGRIVLLKVISIITFLGTIVTNFVLTVVNFENRNVELFAIVLLMLIASVLGYIYFLTSSRNERIRKMFIVTSSVLTVLIVIYAVIYIIKDVSGKTNPDAILMYPYYLLLFSYATLSTIPLAIHLSLSGKEEEQEKQPKEEIPVDQQQ